jgi:hypothetical protein
VPTLPVPPGPEIDPSEVSAFYDDVLNELLVGEPVDGAWTRLLDAGWQVEVDDLDDPTDARLADVRNDRVLIVFRDFVVVGIVVG